MKIPGALFLQYIYNPHMKLYYNVVFVKNEFS